VIDRLRGPGESYAAVVDAVDDRATRLHRLAATDRTAPEAVDASRQPAGSTGGV
jgi:hypothetical protein